MLNEYKIVKRENINEDILSESEFSDYELYQILEQNGYKTHNENLRILKEGLSRGKYDIAEGDDGYEHKNIELCGRGFRLPIHYDAYSGEEILDNDRKSLDSFLSKLPSMSRTIKQKAMAYIMGDIKGKVSDEASKFSDFKFEKDADVFKFIKPQYIYIPRASGKVAIMCTYRFDLGHGIAITADLKGNAVSISSQDYIL